MAPFFILEHGGRLMVARGFIPAGLRSGPKKDQATLFSLTHPGDGF